MMALAMLDFALISTSLSLLDARLITILFSADALQNSGQFHFGRCANTIGAHHHARRRDEFSLAPSRGIPRLMIFLRYGPRAHNFRRFISQTPGTCLMIFISLYKLRLHSLLINTVQASMPLHSVMSSPQQPRQLLAFDALAHNSSPITGFITPSFTATADLRCL